MYGMQMTSLFTSQPQQKHLSNRQVQHTRTPTTAASSYPGAAPPLPLPSCAHKGRPQ